MRWKHRPSRGGARRRGAAARLLVLWPALWLALSATALPALGRDRPGAAAPPGGDETASAAAMLPAVLGPGDRARYRRIFALQTDGHWRRADAEIRKLKNRVLLGHVMAQRYMHPYKYRSRYAELRDWLRRYADHPDARRIHKLALRRKPKGAPAPRRPSWTRARPAAQEAEPAGGYVSDRKRSSATRRLVRKRLGRIAHHARRGRLGKLREILSWRSTKTLFDPTEAALARSYFAHACFFHGSNGEAYRLASGSVDRAGPYRPMAYWIAGLAAYRKGRYEEAAGRFEAMADSDELSDWTFSAAAFWAARSNLVARKPAHVTSWLKKAAARDRSFYGLLAGRILGIDRRFDWDGPELTAKRASAVAGHRAGRRALGLLEVGQFVQAERELAALARAGDEELARALMAVAEARSLPFLALRAAGSGAAAGAAPPDRALYPVPRWRPEEGFAVDRAVVYAFMRQESRFDVRAMSHAGARGLMQVMPSTAGFMLQKRFRRRDRPLLYDPEFNVSVGQRYLRYLIGHETVNGDVLMLAAAYNGGPGNLAKWRRRAAKHDLGDPLLFIESIPFRETRIYIERVLANLWIYRSRLGQPTPTLDRLAAGGIAVYESLDRDGGADRVAGNARN